jgi:hypothetical protein
MSVLYLDQKQRTEITDSAFGIRAFVPPAETVGWLSVPDDPQQGQAPRHDLEAPAIASLPSGRQVGLRRSLLGDQPIRARAEMDFGGAMRLLLVLCPLALAIVAPMLGYGNAVMWSVLFTIYAYASLTSLVARRYQSYARSGKIAPRWVARLEKLRQYVANEEPSECLKRNR